ncbi:MAG: PHB depolymerase family esterase [Flavobacteriales bacterium]|nr:PHB depolymerase family esterase [Flavobacteriales bacterium]
MIERLYSNHSNRGSCVTFVCDGMDAIRCVRALWKAHHPTNALVISTSLAEKDLEQERKVMHQAQRRVKGLMHRGASISKPFLVVCILLRMNYLFGQETFEVKDFGPDPGNLRMIVHLPPNMEADVKRYPMVVALHGCTQNAEELLEMTGWDKLADLREFILLCPEQRSSNNVMHCFDWFRDKDAVGDKGELASIMSMVEHVKRTWPIDTGRVFIYGVSAGAAMAVNAMVGHPTSFRAGATIAGGPFLGNASMVTAARSLGDPPDRTPPEWRAVVHESYPNASGPWPRLIVMHGTKDKIVDQHASQELTDQWLGLTGLDAETDRSQVQMNGHPAISQLKYNDGAGRAVVTSFLFEGVGHAIVIDAGDGPCQGGITGRRSVDLDFHSTCVIGDLFGL